MSTPHSDGTTRVLVTGAAGFLGSHLLRAVRERGYVARAFVHRTPPSGSLAAEVETFSGDVRDVRAVAEAVRGADIVIHTVSNFRHAGSDKLEAHAVNVEGSLNVARAASEAGARQLVHCSTIGVHGSVKQIPADEETPFNPGDLYQETKLEAEQRVREHARSSGLVTTVIRPISIIGPGDTRMLKLFRMIQKRRFVMVGPGEAYFQPAYIDDVVSGFLLALDNERAADQVFIVGGEEYVSLNELAATIADELGVRTPHLRLPLGPMLAAATLCEWVCAPVGIEPPLHRRRISFFQNNRAFRIDKARRLLGFEPAVDLREGIRRTIRAYRDAGWLAP